jgi:hypothetical protein
MDALFGVSEEEKRALAGDAEKAAATAIEVSPDTHRHA